MIVAAEPTEGTEGAGRQRLEEIPRHADVTRQGATRAYMCTFNLHARLQRLTGLVILDYYLQTSQSGVVASHKELKRIREDNRQMEKVVQQQRDDIDAVHKQLQAEKTARHQLTQQVCVMMKSSPLILPYIIVFFIQGVLGHESSKSNRKGSE